MGAGGGDGDGGDADHIGVLWLLPAVRCLEIALLGEAWAGA